MIWLLSRSKLVLFYIYDLLSLILLLHEVDFSYKKIRLAWFCHLQFNVNCIDWLRRIFVGLNVWFFSRKNCSLSIWSNESIFFFKRIYFQSFWSKIIINLKAFTNGKMKICVNAFVLRAILKIKIDSHSIVIVWMIFTANIYILYIYC